MAEGDATWMTYTEVARALNLPSARAALQRSRRGGWPRRQHNDDKLVRVGVPAQVLAASRNPSRPSAKSTREGINSSAREVTTGVTSGDAGELVGELRRRAEAAETERERVEGERERLATELIAERERRAKAEGQAMTLRHSLENALGRADRAEARADAEARTAIEARRQVTEAMMQVASLQTERDTALASRNAAKAAAEATQAAQQAAERERDAARGELAELTAGGRFEQVWRILGGRQASGLALRDVAVGIAGGAVVAFLTWAILR